VKDMCMFPFNSIKVKCSARSSYKRSKSCRSREDGRRRKKRGGERAGDAREEKLKNI